MKTRIFRGATVGAALALMAPQTVAQTATTAEIFQLDGNQITIHAHEFLGDTELATLRAVGRQRDALALFMGEDAGHGAIAVAPDEGFVRDGVPAPSAAALAQLPDPASARSAALDMCNEARSSGPGCVVVLEIAPLN